MTDVRTELSRLQAPGGGGYYRSRIPCAEDSEIARAISAFSESTPREQAAFRAGIDRSRAGMLQVWSERIAALAVRLDSPRPLVLGLVGLSLAQADADLAGARWLAEQRDSEDQPEDAGYVEDDDGEGFRYERDGGGLGLR